MICNKNVQTSLQFAAAVKIQNFLEYIANISNTPERIISRSHEIYLCP